MELYNDELKSKDWFQRIMKSEGGMNWKEPASCGGKSYAGISQKTYEEWRETKCTFVDAPGQVEELAGNALDTNWEKASPLDIPPEFQVRVDVIVAFYKDYFKKAYIELLPECLQYIHADFFVNTMYNSNKILQRMCGFKDEDNTVDGVLGPASRQRLKDLCRKLEADIETDSTADDDLIMEFHDRKMDHYESLKGKPVYDMNIRGWRKRAHHVLGELEDYFYDENPTTSAILDDEEHHGLFDDDTDDVETLPDENPVGSDNQLLRETLGKIAELISKVI